jgi:hypothetical protein
LDACINNNKHHAGPFTPSTAASSSTAREVSLIMTTERFAKRTSKAAKRTAGRPVLGRTPLTIRSSELLGEGFKRRIRTQLARGLGRAAGLIERITVRFEDVNGPKGGIDTICRIKAVLSGRPSIVVEKRTHSHATAFAGAVTALRTAVGREQGKHALRTGPRPGPKGPTRVRTRQPDAGELIGRRVGRGRDALARALRRPEKLERAHYVDTAARGMSASDRRAGDVFTARRNTRGRTTRATVTLEDSRTRPSRKSTRRSANRGKPSHAKEHAAAVQLSTPQARSIRRG